MKIVSTEAVPFDDQGYGAVVSRNIGAARARTRASQAALAVRMRALGYSWYPQTIGLIERGERRLEIGELLAIALALETSVGALLDPSTDDPFVELPSGQRVQAGTVQRSVRHFNDGRIWWEGDTPRFDGAEAETSEDAEREMDPLLEWDTPENWRRRADRIGPKPVRAEDVPPPPEIKQPVVAAIVTSAKGVLIGRRVDGSPPWTFIAGEVEPGERPEDAAVREVKEETGCEVRAGEVIGERDHPVTGRHMIYMAATPARSTRLVVGDEDELAEVRWASLGEALELLPGMFGPVREYLERQLGAEAGS